MARFESRRRGLGSLAALLLAGVVAGVSGAAVPAPRQISVDPFDDTTGQHETGVEPDSFSFGNDVVAVFQVGRRERGGASGIGFATSHDGGSSWTNGVIPLPIAPGSLDLASDPAIAYDRVHGVWVASILGGVVLPSDPDVISIRTTLLAARSGDGVSWTASVMDPSPGHDKNWIACDNGPSSPHAGRCYVVWTGVIAGATVAALSISSSDDGGLTWTPPVTSGIEAFGVMPLVEPDGTLVVLFAAGEATRARIAAVRSTDGGRTFGTPLRVASLRAHDVGGLRVFPFHSAEIARDGRIFVAWPDCRFRAGCSANDIVYASSPDGRKWTAPLRVPTGPQLAGMDHVLPGLAVDATATGQRPRLALAFYALSPRGCRGAACSFGPFFVSSPDGGHSWSTPQQLEAPAPAEWFPLAGSRFVGDYISTSFVSAGTAVPVFAWASAPFDGRFHQGIYATAVPPQPAQAAVALGRARVRVATLIEARASARPTAGGKVSCSAATGRRALRVVRARLSAGTATCTWRVGASGRVTGTIVLIAPEGRATRRFSALVRR